MRRALASSSGEMTSPDCASISMCGLPLLSMRHIQRPATSTSSMRETGAIAASIAFAPRSSRLALQICAAAASRMLCSLRTCSIGDSVMKRPLTTQARICRPTIEPDPFVDQEPPLAHAETPARDRHCMHTVSSWCAKAHHPRLLRTTKSSWVVALRAMTNCDTLNVTELVASALAQGPLAGLRVVEFAGLGPAPFCGMLLSDLGADVVRIDRKDARPAEPHHVTHRGRRSLALDLKNSDAVALCLDLFERAEIVFEGFRPGVMERLGLGPDVALEAQSETCLRPHDGMGTDGPLAQAAGHDINYIAITGALACDRHARAAGAAAQSRRRFRRRRALSRVRLACGADACARDGPGPGGRCRDVRRRGVADGLFLRLSRGRRAFARARDEPARRRRAVL